MSGGIFLCARRNEMRAPVNRCEVKHNFFPQKISSAIDSGHERMVTGELNHRRWIMFMLDKKCLSAEKQA
jgi:hypothetical protein